MPEKYYGYEEGTADEHNFVPEKGMSFHDWIKAGLENGWCGPPVCSTHDGIPYSHEEEEAWNEGDDPCAHVIRLYEDAQQKASVEKTHSPTQWRNHYTK
jgi:hypothetical protein